MNTSMKNSYKNTLGKIYSEQPSKVLFTHINDRIAHTKVIRARIRAGAYGLLSLASAVCLVPLVKYAATEAAHSGLYDYLSLLVSDTSYFFQNWKLTIASIAESLPVAGIMLTLGILTLAIYAFKKSSVYVGIMKINIINN